MDNMTTIQRYLDIAQLDSTGPSQHAVQRLTWLNGLIIGLSLSAGVWGRDLWAWLRMPAPLGRLVTILLGILLVTTLCAVVSWLVARFSNALVGAAIWLVAGLIINQIIGHTVFEVRTLFGWLEQWPLRGILLYPPIDTLGAKLFVSGFFIVLVITMFGLLQDYRLTEIGNELLEEHALTGRGRWLLLLPIPALLGIGLIVDRVHNRPIRVALTAVYQIIDGGRTYEGDLFWYGQQQGPHYIVIEQLRDQMSADYTVSLARFGSGYGGVQVAAEFDNGFLMRCRVAPRGDNGLPDYVTFCADAMIPYTVGFTSALTGKPIPETCRFCGVEVPATWQTWLEARRGAWDGAPQLTRRAVAGLHVLMRAESADGSHAIDCLFAEDSPVTLVECRDVR
jgi:hypothetical protein